MNNSAGAIKFDTALDTSGFKKGVNQINSEAKRSGNALQKVGTIAGGVTKSFLKVSSVAATALAGVVAAGVKSYADYEQNLGGVETLFKDSADKVVENAKNAYKTAGVSANEYMAGVTSFSASLLQSLGGDTEKAADVADMAFRDMSDNANKFGTDMSSIQMAYQGFAKQNYTMLDNLKLGYGGTKTEMQRLLKDAEKLTGQKYDISNLSDVYNAIHAIQENLGVTGTTAEEAEKTISGSVNSMKAAFDNFLNGSGTPEALAETVTNVLTNVSNAILKLAPNILTGIVKVIESLIPQVAKILVDLVPQLLDAVGNMIDSILKLITGNTGKVEKVITDLIIAIGTFITTNIPKILQILVSLLTAIVQGLSNAIPVLVPAIIQGLIQIVMALIQAIPVLVPALIRGAIQLVVALVNALPQIIMALIQALPMIITSIIQALLLCIPQLIEGAIQLVMGLVKAMPQIIMALVKQAPYIVSQVVIGIISAAVQMVKAGAAMIKNLWNGFKSGVAGFFAKVVNFAKSIPTKIKNAIGAVKDIGLNIVKGIGNGITSGVSWIKDKITEFVGNVKGFLKKLFGIKSPSKWAKVEIGGNIVIGIAKGLADKKHRSEVKKAASELSDDVKKQLKGKNTNYKKIGSIIGQEFVNGINESLKKLRDTADKFKETLSSTELLNGKKLVDLSKVKEQIVEYGNNLKKLKNQIPETLYSKVMEMDREQGLTYTKKLLSMSKGDLKAYINNWNAIQSEANKISNDWYETQAKKEVNTLTAKYTKELNAKLGALKKLMGGLGKKASKGLIAGMLSQTKDLKGASKSITDAIIKTMKKQLKIKSPSRVTKEIGVNLDKGLVNGIEASKKAVMNTVDAFGNDIVDRMRMAVELETGNVNAMASIKANAEFGQTIVVNSETKGDVFLDNQKVGQVVTPVVSKTLKKAGVK